MSNPVCLCAHSLQHIPDGGNWTRDTARKCGKNHTHPTPRKVHTMEINYRGNLFPVSGVFKGKKRPLARGLQGESLVGSR